MDLTYYESGYIEDGYLVYTADANSSITSILTITIDAGIIFEVSSNLHSSFSQYTVISNIYGSDLFAFTEAALQAQVDRIRETNVSVSGVFSTAIDGTRGIYVSAQADAFVSIDVYNERTRNEEVAQDAAFSLSAINDRIIECQSFQTTDFTIELIIEKIVEAASIQTSDFTVVASLYQSGAPVSGESNLTSNFTESVTVGKIIEVNCQQSSEFTLISNPYRTIEFVVVIDSLFDPSIIINPIKNSFAVLDAVISLTIDAIRIAELSSDCSSQATLSIDYDRVREFDLLQESNFEQFVSSERTVGFNSLLELTTEQTAIANKIFGFDSQQLSEFTLTSDPYRTIEFTVVIDSLFEPSITINPIKNTFAVLDSVAYMDIIPDVTKELISDISCNFTNTVSGLKLRELISDQTTNASLVFYPSFSNKRPRSVILSSGLSFDTSLKQYGSASLKIVNSATGLRIQTIPGSNLDLGPSYEFSGLTDRDFNIEFWARITSNTIQEGEFKQIASGYGWNIGLYRISGVTTGRATYYDSRRGTRYTYRVDAAGSTILWKRWKFSRINGGVVTFSVGNSSSTSGFANERAVDYNDYIQLSFANGTINIDEFYFGRYGVSQPLYYKESGEINDGALSTTEALFHFNGDYTDDVTGIVPLTPKQTLSLTASLSIASEVLYDETVSFSSIFAQTASAQRIKEVTAVLASEFTQATTVNRIRYTNSQVNSEFAATITTIANKTLESYLDATGSQLIVNGRIRAEVADLDSNFELTTIANVDYQTSAVLDAISTLVIDPIIYRDFDSQQDAAFGFTALGSLGVDFAADLTLTAEQTVDFTRIKAFESHLEAFSTEVTANGRIRTEFAELTSNFSLSATYQKTSEIIVSEIATTTLEVTATRIKSFDSNQSNTFVQLVIPSVTKTLVSNQEVTATEELSYVRVRDSQAAFQALNSQLIVNGRIRAEFANLDSEFSLSAKLSNQGKVDAVLQSNFTQQVTGDKLRQLSADITSIATLTAQVGYVVSSSSTMSSLISLTANGRLFGLSEDLTYIIQKEIRLFVIPQENREWTITPEDRTFIIG